MPTGTLKLEVEDLTGRITAIVSIKKPDLAKEIPYLVPDEVLAFKGSFAKDVFFVDEVVWPDIPHKQRTYSPDEAYAVFTGDIHSGSNMFLPKEFDKFVQWLKGNYGDNDMKDLAKKTRYIFLLGDLIDGVGIYPEQEKELHVKDAAKQYDMLAKYLAEIPPDKKIIIINKILQSFLLRIFFKLNFSYRINNFRFLRHKTTDSFILNFVGNLDDNIQFISLHVHPPKINNQVHCLIKLSFFFLSQFSKCFV